MKEFDKIKDMLLEEIVKISDDGQLTMDALCVLDKIADLWKDLCQVEMYEENDVNAFLEEYSRESGYSGRSNIMRSYNGNGGSYNNGDSYGDSYRSGRRMSGNGYSRDDGTKQEMVRQLEKLWNEARDEHDRNAIKKVIDSMK